MYTALYRAHRPEVFGEILGQEHIIKILENQIANDQVSHAYLFCGTRGTGKTTTARILAKGVNCTGDQGIRPCGICSNCMSIKAGTFMDVIEIDAASNNGVENIRELRESVKYPPSTGRKKVYIIDEVHMLSTGAFNALLKTLEEPPENVMFILATTEAQKLPATILSRCMRLDFKRVPESILTQGMEKICSEKEIQVSTGALRLIAANADGSVRDGLSILDQCICAGQIKVDREDVLEFLGTSGEEVFIDLTEMMTFHHVAQALVKLEEVLQDGKDVRQFMKDWLSHYRNLLITKFIKNPEDMLNISCENVERVRSQSDTLDIFQINQGIIQLSKTMAEAKWSTQPRILLELCMVKLATDFFDQQPVTSTPKPAAPISKPVDVAQKSSASNQKSVMVKATSLASGKTSEKPSVDLDGIWHSVFEEGEAAKGSFNLIRSGTKLISIQEEDFIVLATNETVAGYVENNRIILEEIMERQTQIRRKLVCVQNQNEEEQTEDINQIAKTAEDRLGINIEIE
ncbi:MAG: DNA polymerase III subunit gamma/tau [Anaerovoracaceae bacterium]